MKTVFRTPFLALALLVIALPAFAEPRLVVSTPSLTPESTLEVVLDHPAVAPDALGKTVENTWLDVKPTLPGKLVWRAQNVLSYVPEQTPALGETYEFSIRKNQTHLDGSPVPAGKFATIDSEKFRLFLASSLNRWSSDYSPTTATWTLVFNDDVDPATAKPYIHFKAKGGVVIPASVRRATVEEAGYYIHSYRSWTSRTEKTPAPTDPNAEVPHILVVSPESPLPVGDDWALILGKGLPNASGKASFEVPSAQNIGKIEPFQVTSIRSVVEVNQPRQIEITFNHLLPEDPSTFSFDSNLEITPRPENLKVSIDKRTLTLSGDFQGKHVVTVKPPLTSRTGLTLSAPKTANLEFKYIDPGIGLPSEDQAQYSEGNRTYRVEVVNIRSLHIRIKRLAGSDLIRTGQGYRHYTGIGHDQQTITPTAPLPYALVNGQTLLEKEIRLEVPADHSQEITLDWTKILPPDLKHTTLFLDIVGTPLENIGKEGRRNVQAIIQLTDIGLAWKLTEKEALVYAFSCQTGKPLPDVTLHLLGEDAAPLHSVTTDATGQAKFTRTPDIRHLQATLGGDSFVTAFDSSLATVGLWHFPVRFSWSKPAETQRRAFLFSDRSLYRPGETVRLKGIVRTQRGNAIEASEPSKALLKILDPQENTLSSTDLTISEKGSFDLTYTLPSGVTGTYLFRLEYPDELAKAEETDDWELKDRIQTNASFDLNVQVEEFRRNAFELTQNLATPEIGGTRVSAALHAAYYQGQPVAAGKVDYYSRVTSTNLYPERFRDFLFGDHRTYDWQYWYHYFGYNWDDEQNTTSVQAEGTATLAADGKATLDIDLPQSDFPTAREVTISSDVTDANHQTLSTVSKTTVHPADVYVGVSRDDRLIRVGDPVTLKLVAIDPEGNPHTSPVTVTAIVSRNVNSATKSRNENGEVATQNQVSSETVFTGEITIDPAASAKDGQDFTFTPTVDGEHFLTLRGTDSQGRPFATVTRHLVYGAREFPWKYEDGLRVKTVSEKKSYRPGDTARVLVLSPIEGTALVTVERERVLRTFQVELKADNPVIEVPLTAEDAPNVFVSILIVKGAADSAREHPEPQLRLGYCELIVENLHDRLNVAFEHDEQPPSCRPGDTITISGTISLADGKPAAGAEVTLYAEDEGTLAVMGYETPRPMNFFYSPRILGVETGVSTDHFISEDPENQTFHNKGFFIGGGADLGELAKLYRKNFDPCATWAPALTCDASGKFTHTFTVPDTLTRYRLIAVAHHAASRFGTGESAIVVKKDVMLEPKAPRFANQTDTFRPQVLVQNASAENGTWEITLASENDTLTLGGDLKQTVTLAPGASATVVFDATASNTGEAILKWNATPVTLASGDITPEQRHRLSDAVETRFPVHYPVPLLRQHRSLHLTANQSQNLLANLDPSLLQGRGDLTLEVASSPLVEAGDAIDFLLRYPYGCVEQTTSALIPWFAVEPLRPYVPALANHSEEKVRDAIQHGVNQLLSMQLPDGSFSYWPGNLERVDWATSYAGLGLLMASEWGEAHVPQTAIDQLTKALIESLRGAADTKSPYGLEIHARTLFVLSLAGQPQPSYQNILKDRLAQLTPNARTFLAMAIVMTDEDNAALKAQAKAILTSKIPFRGTDDRWMPATPDHAYQLIAWLAIDPEAQETHRALELLMRDRNPYGHWSTTWNNGWALLALAQYASLENASPTASITLGAETLKLTEETPTFHREYPLAPDLKLDATSDGKAYIRVKLASKPDIAPLKPMSANGLAIDRIYERVKPDGSTEILTQPAVGDLVKVTLRVTLPRDNSRYLVIEDPLPAIFETVNTDFKSQSAANAPATSRNDWRVSHSELRDDKAVFFLNEVWKKGTYSLSYLARCTVAGTATAPQAKVESMYDPTNVALSASRTFEAK
ncbi:MAG: MG2 domain-containing protein [Luteolibacter sp.]